MNKINLVNKKKAKYANIKIKSSQMINMREVEAISQCKIPGVIPPNIIKGKIIQYNVSNYITLDNFFKVVVSRKTFVSIITQIFDIIAATQSIMLNPSYFIYDKKFVFIEPNIKKVFLLYVPIINYEHSNNVKTFYQSLAFDTVFNQTEDCTYVREYINYFNSHINFSVYEFETFIKKYQDKEASVNVERKSSGLLSGKLGSGKLANGVRRSIPVEHIRENEINRSGLTGTTVLGAEECGTTILSANVLNKKNYPYLIRVKTGERIDINKDEFRIGKSRTDNDYSISDNGAISRKHLKIIIDNDNYYALDDSSTNGTYIDDVRIKAGEATQIKPGQLLRLADEELNFEI